MIDIRQDIYEQVLVGAQRGLPTDPRNYLFAVARNRLINLSKRAKIVSFEAVADIEGLERNVDVDATERLLTARDELRRAKAGIDQLSPRCREVVLLRKVEGLSTEDAAARLGVSKDTIRQHLKIGMPALIDYMLGGSGRIVRPDSERRRRRARKP